MELSRWLELSLNLVVNASFSDIFSDSSGGRCKVCDDGGLEGNGFHARCELRAVVLLGSVNFIGFIRINKRNDLEKRTRITGVIR